MTSIMLLQHQRPDGEVDTYHVKAGRRYHFGRGSQCQVRVLDLKLSRQHCAFEFLDDGWKLIDLASTNGCAIDGTRVSGSRPLTVGAVVTAGSSTLRVQGIIDSATAPAADPPAAFPEQGEIDPPRASDRLAAAAARSSSVSDELEPQSVSSRKTLSDPLIPGLPADAGQPRKVAVGIRQERTPAPDAEPGPMPGLDHDVLATLPPVQAAPAAAETGSRTFYINVLGRRVGPLTRNQARELKTKELKGSLTPADLADLEAQAAAQAPAADLPEPAAVAPPPPPPAAAGDEQATYYITLLGQRVGPLTRTQARDYKARELAGSLTQADIAHLLPR